MHETMCTFMHKFAKSGAHKQNILGGYTVSLSSPFLAHLTSMMNRCMKSQWKVKPFDPTHLNHCDFCWYKPQNTVCVCVCARVHACVCVCWQIYYIWANNCPPTVQFIPSHHATDILCSQASSHSANNVLPLCNRCQQGSDDQEYGKLGHHQKTERKKNCCLVKVTRRTAYLNSSVNQSPEKYWLKYSGTFMF